MLEKKELEYEGTILELIPPVNKEPTCIVQVEGVAAAISDKKLLYFFSNPKRGGKVTDVKTLNNLRFVTFANREGKHSILFFYSRNINVSSCICGHITKTTFLWIHHNNLYSILYNVSNRDCDVKYCMLVKDNGTVIMQISISQCQSTHLY